MEISDEYLLQETLHPLRRRSPIPIFGVLLDKVDECVRESNGEPVTFI